MVQAPPGVSEVRLYTAMLDYVYAPYKRPRYVEQLASEMLKLLRHCAVRMIIIDEVQVMLSVAGRSQRRFLDTLKWLGNELRVPIVAIGTEEAHRAFLAEPQIANRFRCSELRRWCFNGQFLQLLVAFETRLPLEKPSALHNDAIAREIHTLSEGLLGEVAAIIKAAAIHEIRTKRERISLATLKAIDYTPPSGRRV
jgi:hypothetical protein